MSDETILVRIVKAEVGACNCDVMSSEALQHNEHCRFRVLADAFDYVTNNEQAFELRWNADMRAIRRWQTANPGNDLVWPDHADLVVWLLDQLKKEKAANEQ